MLSKILRIEEQFADSKFPWQLPKIDSIYRKKKATVEKVDRRLVNGFINNELGITFREHPKYKNREIPYPTEHKQMLKFLKSYDVKNECFNTHMILPAYGWGRSLDKLYCSLNIMHRPTRHFYCFGVYVDMDMKNAHLVVLLAYARYYGLKCNGLAEYCKDPKRWRERISIFHNVSKGDAKTLCIALANGGSYDKWVNELFDDITYVPNPKYGRKGIDILIEMHDELAVIIDIVWENNQQIFFDVLESNPKKWKSGSDINEAKRGVMALWSQTWERIIQETCIVWLKEVKKIPLKTIVPCQDGMMVLVQDFYPALVDELNAYINSVFPFGIEWLDKPFDERDKINIPLHEELNEKFTIEELPKMITSYFNINTDNISIVEDNGPWINENLLLECESKFIALWAFMGKGKTTSIKKLLDLNPESSVLFVTPRVSLADFISADFKITHYKDVKNKSQNLKKPNRLVCQLESLKNVRDSYDYLIIDESESVLNQYSSEKTMREKYTVIYLKLRNLLNQSTKVIFADAFMSNRTLNLLRGIVDSSSTISMIKNISPPHMRTAVEIDPNKFDDKLLTDLLGGAKCFACFSSKQQMIEFKRMLETQWGVDRVNDLDVCIFYHGDMDDKTSLTLGDINKTWKKPKLIACTPSLSVGCSYNEKEHSELMFNTAYAKCMATCVVRDTCQAIHRVRHTISTHLYFSIEEIYKTDNVDEMLATFEDYNLNGGKLNLMKKYCQAKIDSRNTFDENNKLISDKYQSIINKLDNYPETDPHFQDVLTFNFKETIMSNTYYRPLFYEFAKRSGYTIVPYQEDINKVPTILNEKDYVGDWRKIDNINFDKYDLFVEYKDARCLTSQQKDAMDKFRFLHNIVSDEEIEEGEGIRCARIQCRIDELSSIPKENRSQSMDNLLKQLTAEIEINYTVEETKAHIFFDVWLKRERQFIMNANLLKGDLTHIFERDITNADGVLIHQRMRAPMVDYMKEISNKLGMANPFEPYVVVTKETIKNMSSYILSNYDDIATAFRHKSKGAVDNRKIFNTQKKFINMLLSSFLGISLNEYDRDNHNNCSKSYITIPSSIFNYYDISRIFYEVTEREEANNCAGYTFMDDDELEERHYISEFEYLHGNKRSAEKYEGESIPSYFKKARAPEAEDIASWIVNDVIDEFINSSFFSSIIVPEILVM